MKNRSIACIDLFCGAGGLTHGLIAEGLDVVAGIDVDDACRHPFETNNASRFIKANVEQVSSKRINALFGDAEIRVLAGCAPCQPFSTYAQRYDVVGSPRWALLKHFGRLIKDTRPELITMENVPSVTKHAVFDEFVEALEDSGYNVHREVIDSSRFGLPQRRRRMVLLASLLGPIGLIPSTHERPVTVRSAIGRLPPITQGGTYAKDQLHAASKLSDLNLERIRASRPGGTWRDWPKHLVAECHRRETGHTYPGVYGRMVWDEPAPTLTTQFYGFGNGRFGHPEQDRGISLREGAVLQGFPDSYSFLPHGAPIQFKALGRMIGNAVPVVLGRVIGQSISAHLDFEAEQPTRITTGAVADVALKSLVA
ncbi:DNA cytosine methyltransferase [Bauldia litoralis]|uniref:DNA (cytosine-5-)-methyltransferase n=1 Tax=Bauldia litoralis TaxID=665467 RepID=A0A1G6EK88_9HYPH|nr:DNA cytosine methyltransferase [Bauldia litoralis]SDB57800.1 DNA (cytosine-5)-methyltransferase 1 [Bauldia litoralis]